MRPVFRAKVFVGSFAAAAVSLLTLAVLTSWQVRERQRQAIEQHLIDEAQLIAVLLSQVTSLEGSEMDLEADRLGALVSARVTLIADDGRVVGDSTQTPAELAGLDNHLSRPEVVAARADGIGSSQRYSGTLGTDLAYVAVRATHPAVGYVRLALPLTVIDEQLGTIRTAALGALAAAIPLAALVSWFISTSLARRVSAIAQTANATPPVIFPHRPTTTRATSSEQSHGRWTLPSSSSVDASMNCPETAPGWRPSSAAWLKVSWSSTAKAACSW